MADGCGWSRHKSSLKQLLKHLRWKAGMGSKLETKKRWGFDLTVHEGDFFGEILRDLSGITGMVLKDI